MDRGIAIFGSKWGRLAAALVAGVMVTGAGAMLYRGSSGVAAAEDDDVVVDPAERRIVWDEEIKREVALQRERHADRLGRLAALKQALVEANAPAAQVEAVNRAIVEEQEDYESRGVTLSRWLRGAGALPPDALPAAALRGEVNAELRDLGEAIGSLNQSFVVPPIRSRHAAVGGSRYIDVEDDPDRRAQRVPQARPPVGAEPPVTDDD
jgi:hypothetical protein